MPVSQAGSFEKIDFVFLDREGILNRKPGEGHYITTWDELQLLPGVVNALARLKKSGRKLILVTNQRCVSLGLCSEDDVRALHQRLQALLEQHGAALDAIYFCPHTDGECNCRKPGTGMFEEAFRDFPAATPANSIMMGDSLSDIEAGVRVGMRTIFIFGDPGLQKAGAEPAAALATATANSLQTWVEEYLCRE